MQLSTSKGVYGFGEPIDLNFSLSAKEHFRANLFDDRLCNLRFVATESDGRLLSAYRHCVTSESDIPDQGFRDFGPNGNERATYKVSETGRQSIGPDRPLQFTLYATATVDDNGYVLVRLAEDVYFEFIDATTLSIGLAHYRHPIFEDEGRFGAYLKMERLHTDHGEKLAVRPLIVEWPKKAED